MKSWEEELEFLLKRRKEMLLKAEQHKNLILAADKIIDCLQEKLTYVTVELRVDTDKAQYEIAIDDCGCEGITCDLDDEKFLDLFRKAEFYVAVAPQQPKEGFIEFIVGLSKESVEPT